MMLERDSAPVLDPSSTGTLDCDEPTKHFDAIYHRRGFDPGDIAEVKPNMVLLRGVPPPERSAGGIIFGGHTNTAGTQALMFTVVAVGLFEPEQVGAGMSAFSTLQVGDVVVPRHALLDPIGLDKWALCACHVRDVLCIVQRAPAPGPGVAPARAAE